jgi:O-antigen/teichoic acid export membrane protein
VSVYRDIVKHSSVYGAGMALKRVAGVVLLPFYTRFLTPADYGIIALLDLTTAIVSQTAAGGIHNAVLRYHFDPAYKDRRHALWTTGIAMLTLISVPQLALVWMFREGIAAAAFGPDVTHGASYLTLALAGIPAALLSLYCTTYVQAEKRSVLLVGVTVPGLILRIGLNIYLIGFQGMGVYGFLWGSLVGGWVEAIAFVAILFGGRAFRLVPEVIRPMWSYGWPLILTMLAGLSMHQSNRYLLRVFLQDLGPIGIFAVAFTLAQGVNQMIMVPFQSIWSPVMFEIDQLPDRREMYRRIFKYYTLGIGLILLAVSLLSRPIVAVLAAPEFGGAAEVLPWLCLAFFLFTLHSVLRVPALLHHRTVSVAMNSLVAAVVNVGANVALIPRLGIQGAALASVITYGVFSGLGYVAYRRIEDLRFPLRYVAWVGGGGVALCAAAWWAVPATAPLPLQGAVGFLAWAIGAAVTALGPARSLFDRNSPMRQLLRKAPTLKDD